MVTGLPWAAMVPGSARMEGLGGTSGKEPDLRSQGTFSPRFPSCHRPSQMGHQQPRPAVLPSDQGCGWKQEVWGLTWLSLVPRAPAQPWKRVPCERPAPPHVLDAPGLLCALGAGVRSRLRTFPSPPRKSVPTEPPVSLRDQMWEEGVPTASLPRSSPRQRRAVQVRVVALPLMVLGRAGDLQRAQSPQAGQTPRA